MEEIIQNTNQLNTKAFLSTPNTVLHTFYAYSSRYIPMPQKEKEKSPETLIETFVSVNEPFYQEIKQKIQDQYDQLNSYIAQLQGKFVKVEHNQLDWLGNKYRYYIREFKKHSSQQEKLLEIYNNLQTIIIESPPVQEEIKSINFIKMISAQTQKKLSSLKQIVAQAEYKKNENNHQIQNLRMELNVLKNQYFTLKRQQLAMKLEKQEQEKQQQLFSIENTMQKIRFEKKQKVNELKKSNISKMQFSAERLKYPYKHTDTIFQKNFTQNNFSNGDACLKELKNINNENQKYIKKLSQTCQNFKNRKLQQKKKLNSKLISQTDLESFRLKSRQQGRYRKSEQEQLLKNEEIIKQLSLTNRLKDEFRDKKSEQILNILVQSKKLKDLMGIIEEVKRQEIKQNILQKRNLNITRSQMYQNSSAIIRKSFDEDQNYSLIRN